MRRPQWVGIRPTPEGGKRTWTNPRDRRISRTIPRSCGLSSVEQLHQFIGEQADDILWWQMSLRAALIFLLGLLLVRIAASRAFGRWGALDIILAVIVGSNLSRALTGSAPFLPTLVASFLLVALHGGLARAVIRWPGLSEAVKGRSTLLANDGAVIPSAMKRHGIGQGDIKMAVRAQGFEAVEETAAIRLERNGDISVVGKDSA